MGAMSVCVQVGKLGCVGLEGQVGAVVELVGPVEARDRGDAGVDHGHVDVLAGEAGPPVGLGAGHQGGVVQGADVGGRAVRGRRPGGRRDRQDQQGRQRRQREQRKRPPSPWRQRRELDSHGCIPLLRGGWCGVPTVIDGSAETPYREDDVVAHTEIYVEGRRRAPAPSEAGWIAPGQAGRLAVNGPQDR
jgi:hypothetical protein